MNDYDNSYDFLSSFMNYASYVEINGICGGHYQTGNIQYVDHSSLSILLEQRNNWPYFDITVFNLGIKVNENPIKLSLLNTKDKEYNIDFILEGSFRDRFISTGVPPEEFDALFQTITEEEYEHLLDVINE